MRSVMILSTSMRSHNCETAGYVTRRLSAKTSRKPVRANVVLVLGHTRAQCKSRAQSYPTRFLRYEFDESTR